MYLLWCLKVHSYICVCVLCSPVLTAQSQVPERQHRGLPERRAVLSQAGQHPLRCPSAAGRAAAGSGQCHRCLRLPRAWPQLQFRSERESSVYYLSCLSSVCLLSLSFCSSCQPIFVSPDILFPIDLQVREAPLYHLIQARIQQAEGKTEESIKTLGNAMRLPGVRKGTGWLHPTPANSTVYHLHFTHRTSIYYSFLIAFNN